MKPSLAIFFFISFLGVTLNAQAETAFDAIFGKGAEYQNVKVQEVISADRIVIANDTQRGERVRLIGLKAPTPEKSKEPIERDQYGFEVKAEVSPLTDLNQASYEFTRNLLLGKKVRLEFDSYKKNESHETLAYVFLKDNDMFVNEEILKQGYAQLHIQPPNTKYAAQLREAYRHAKSSFKGFHGQ